MHVLRPGCAAALAAALTWFLAGCGSSGVPTARVAAKGDTDVAEKHRQSCETGNATACFELARLHEVGRGVPVEYSEAARLYERSCEAGNGAACSRLGSFYESGIGVKVDFSRATLLFAKACKAGDGYGCEASANKGIHANVGHGAAPSREAAVASYTRACEQGTAEACERLGTLTDKPEAHARAADLYEARCRDGDPFACHNLAEMYDDGRGRPSNPGRRLSLLREACHRGIADACTAIVRHYNSLDERSDETRELVAQYRRLTVALLEEACTGGHGPSCADLAKEFRLGVIVEKDDARYMAFLAKACELDIAEPCVRTAERYHRDASRGGSDMKRAQALAERAARLNERSCEAGLVSACDAAVELYKDDKWGFASERGVDEMRVKACERGSQEACEEAGWKKYKHLVQLTFANESEEQHYEKLRSLVARIRKDKDAQALLQRIAASGRPDDEGRRALLGNAMFSELVELWLRDQKLSRAVLDRVSEHCDALQRVIDEERAKLPKLAEMFRKDEDKCMDTFLSFSVVSLLAFPDAVKKLRRRQK